jgi:hypothetical protein
VWDASRLFYADSDMSAPYALYRMLFGIRHVSGDSYSVKIYDEGQQQRRRIRKPRRAAEGFAPALADDETKASWATTGRIMFRFSFC